MPNYSREEIDRISENVSVLDYFLYLEKSGKTSYSGKQGREHVFKTSNNKYSVNTDRFYNFSSGEGGRIFKAVMTLENKSWKEALDFLASFNGSFDVELAERKKRVTIGDKNDANQSSFKIIYSGKPNNEKLLSYFNNRGISNDVLEQNTRQIHYENNGKRFFGIGIENLSGGFEIRNPLAKIKIGKSDISTIKGTKDEIIVFEGMADKLSFLELQKQNGNLNTRTLVSLNSVTNTDRFIELYKDFKGKIFLCLDGDRAGDIATEKIRGELSNLRIKDVRNFYGIEENGNNDLNDYLLKKINKIQSNLYEQSISTPTESLPNSITMGSRSSEQSVDETRERSQPQQNNHSLGFENERDNARNGFTDSDSTRDDADRGGRSGFISQQENAGKDEAGEHSLAVRIDSTNIPELDTLLDGITQPTNEQILDVINISTYVSDDYKVKLNPNINITDKLKNTINQFRSGGVEKSGRGVLDEYYTKNEIVNSVGNIIKNHFKDFASIEMLEPSVGTGNFIYASENIPTAKNITAFEINRTTAGIAKLFHPTADINLRSFETEFIQDNGQKINPSLFKEKYDLVLGNPPYGEHRGLYKGLGEEPKIAKYEDYFVKRSIDVLKDGGIMAMVLPSSWISRQKKLNDADLVVAYRLPVGAFDGTNVGTDIVILGKNSQIRDKNISNYFSENPENILGEIRERTNRFGRTEPYVYGDISDALKKIETLREQNFNTTKVKIGTLFDDEPTVLEATEKQITIDDNSDIVENVEAAIEKLNNIKFKSPSVIAEIKKYSNTLSSLQNKTFPIEDLPELRSKTDRVLAFHSREASIYTEQSTPSIKPGVLKYNYLKDDKIVPSAIHNNEQLSSALLSAFKDADYQGVLANPDRHFKYANYIDGLWVHDFYYAEGNIYSKLEQLEKDFKNKNFSGVTEEQYEKQKSLLRNVLPKAKTLNEISISPNHEFVHKFSLGTMEKEIWNPDKRQTETVSVPYNLAEKFKDFVGTLSNDAFAGSSSWEVRSFVDNENVTGSDKERNALVRERRKAAANDLFQKFLKEELTQDISESFVHEFNRNYNNVHVPDYSQFPLFSNIHLNFKGSELRLTDVQKSGIGRQTTKGVGLLAHEVGFGKTLSGILSMHEAMERGNAKRPLIVVPNDSILKQWIETVFETIPNAKVNVLGNLGASYDLSKFENKDGEITIVTYEGFNNIGFNKETTERLAAKFNYISSSELKGITNSVRNVQIDLQKEKEIEGRMKRGKVYDWEDFKFDHLTFDEVHNANHIVGKVKINDRRFASDFRNQNQQTSKLGINTWMAAQYIQEQNNGRNVTLLSATPFTNKPLEYYSILSLVANKRLEEAGYFNVNNFFETFMEADNDMEIDAKGDVKFKANVRRFKNNSLFQQLLSEFIDIKGEEDNKELIRPNKINKEYKIEQNSLTREQYQELNENFNETEKGAILSHILNARLIAISPYLSPYYRGEPPTAKEFIENSPKLLHTMALIEQNKKDLSGCGQIIYSELAVKEFQKLKDYLVDEIGYKPEEIGIITGASTKPSRLKTQSDFNSGKIKIIIGSEAIQEGMNLQTNSSDLYMLSLPYNFTSLRQTEGRIWRQGNKNENIRINFMLTNDSIDVFMLQKLQAKQARYMEAMKKGADVLDISDISTQELKTSIITDPVTRANIDIELLKKRLESEKNRHLADEAFVLRKFKDFLNIKEDISKAEQVYNRIQGYAKDDDYWSSQLPSYQKAVDLAQQKLEETIIEFRKKGVDVSSIEQQTSMTKNKIEEIESKLEELPSMRAELINHYEAEKKSQIENRKLNETNLQEERKLENIKLYKTEVLNSEANYNAGRKR